MTAWQSGLENLLGATEAPPVLTRGLLERFARSAKSGQEIPASTLSAWIRRATDAGKLTFVQRGLYLNNFRPVHGRLADTVPLLYKDAIVSLNTVLGDAGVLNNPSNAVTVVVPIDRNASLPHLGRKHTRAGTVHGFGLPRHILQAGRPVDRLEPERAFSHVRATREKALLDWLYLGRSPRSRRTPPPRNDIDMSMLNLRRLKRLASAAGLADELARWAGPL